MFRCNCAMERFYEWASQQDESKGFSSVMCLNPVGVRGIRLTDLRSKDSLVCAAPEIVPTTSEVQAQKGHQAYLPCYNTAEPLAQTSWSFKGNKVENNSKVSHVGLRRPLLFRGRAIFTLELIGCKILDILNIGR